MKELFSFLIISGLLTFSFGADHGMYMLTNKNIKGDYSKICDQVKDVIKSKGFRILADRDITTPDRVKKDQKYLAASMLRVGVHETNEGIQVIIADPETINRIIFNDLKDDQYNKIVKSTILYKNKIIDALHSLKLGTNVNEAREPKRSTDDLRDASKDMIMMVGDMTFFEDEDQFPEIYSQKNDVSVEGLEKLKQKLYANIKSFTPNQEDKDYRWSKDLKEDLKWKVVGEVYSPDKKAILFGLTRNQTEGVSFYIVGDETKENSCPGLDHLTAYPIEVLLMIKGDKIVVHTPREMLRMDMYFWDAGMAAFTNHMSMPGILDESIYRALFGKDKD